MSSSMKQKQKVYKAGRAVHQWTQCLCWSPVSSMCENLVIYVVFMYCKGLVTLCFLDLNQRNRTTGGERGGMGNYPTIKLCTFGFFTKYKFAQNTCSLFYQCYNSCLKNFICSEWTDKKLIWNSWYSSFSQWLKTNPHWTLSKQTRRRTNAKPKSNKGTGERREGGRAVKWNTVWIFIKFELNE